MTATSGTGVTRRVLSGPARESAAPPIRSLRIRSSWPFPTSNSNSRLALARAKGTRRLFLGELKGRIYSFDDDRGCRKTDLALDLAKIYPDLNALYGMAFHPEFDNNRYVYVCYVRKYDIPDGAVVSRFTASRTDPPVIDPQSELTILKYWSGGHSGGCLNLAIMDSFIFPPEKHSSRHLLTSC